VALSLAVLAVVGAFGAVVPSAMASGRLVDLGSLQSGCGSAAVAINDHGEVAGTSCNEPFRWTAAHGMEGLGGLATPDVGAAEAINGKGEVTGYSGTVTGGAEPSAFLWTPAKGMQEIVPGGPGAFVYGQAINNDGMVAVTFIDPDSTGSAGTWTHAGGYVGAATLGGTLNRLGNSAAVLNAHGDLTGVASLPTPTTGPYAFLYTQSGGTQNLGALAGDVQSEGVAVNNHLDVIGDSANADGVQRAFLWTPSAGMQELMLPGGTASDAYGLNNKGDVVGYTQFANGATDAFRWTPQAGLTDLGAGKAVAINQNGEVAIAGTTGDAYQWTVSGGLKEIGPGTPSAINDRGQITINVTNGDAFLWTPRRS
jgi:probable HAF family extracellular repeat protein